MPPYTTRPFIKTFFVSGVFLTAMLSFETVFSSANDAPGVVHPHREIACGDCHGAPRASHLGARFDDGTAMGNAARNVSGVTSDPLSMSGRAAPGSAMSSDAAGTSPSLKGGSGACSGCHSPIPRTGLAGAFHGDTDLECTKCHSFHDTSRLTAAGQAFSWDFENPAMEAHCTTCHGADRKLAQLSDGHVAATALYHAGAAVLQPMSLSDACLVCHSRDREATLEHILRSSSSTGVEDAPTPMGSAFVEIAASAPRFHEQATHPFGVPVASRSTVTSGHLRSSFDSRLPLFDDRIECQTCHAITEVNGDLLVPYETKYDLCLGCHQFGGGQTFAARLGNE